MLRLNKKRVEEIFTRSKQEKWAYPKIFDALKEAGVEYYETGVATHDIVYHGSRDAIPRASAAGVRALNSPSSETRPSRITWCS
jgi:hypothetical protein